MANREQSGDMYPDVADSQEDRAGDRTTRDTLIYELQRLAIICNTKRQNLIEVGRRSERMAKHVTVAAGLLALTATLLSSAVFFDLIGATGVKATSAVLGFGSAFTSLILTNYFNTKESDEMFEGAALYLEIRDRCDLNISINGASEARLRAALAKVREQYAKCAKRYDRYYRGKTTDIPPQLTRLAVGVGKSTTIVEIEERFAVRSEDGKA